ncbi:MAG: oligoendopeptidase F [Rhabdochlamydiaceae bacterium]|nr:oligoendopeptidase F [Candidatus Amphrikana amoebophyrae]
MAKKRTDMPQQDLWGVDTLYKDFDEWNCEFAKLRKQMDLHFPQINDFRGKIGESTTVLIQFLNIYFSVQENIEQLYVYAHLRHDEDIALDEHKAFYQMIVMLYHAFAAETAWVEPEILQIDQSKLDLKGENLQEYSNYLVQLFHQKAHVLPKEQERIMAAAGDPLGAINGAFSSINNVDLKFFPAEDGKGEKHEVTHAAYQLLVKSQDRVLRKNAFLSMHSRFGDFENTIAELLSGSVKKHLFNARVRGHDTCLDSALFPYNIDRSVYTSLIGCVRKNLGAIHSYVALRKEMLGLDEIHAYDMYVPAINEFDMKFDFDEASKLIIESVAPLGKEYQDILAHGLGEARWVDRYENENKRSGAYSCSCYKSKPYILMNYKGTFNDVMTLSHEAGHSMHSYHSNKHQSYQDASYCIFVAEVASTFHEELTFRHLFENATSVDEKIYILNQKIDSIRSTLIRQTMFAEFELRIHEIAENHMPLTPAIMKREYESLNRDYFGPDFVYDDALFNEYLRIPHFYSNFYVYQYATGISAAYALVERVLTEGEPARADYLNFLSSGRSDYPVDLLKKAGVDMTTEKPVQILINRFEFLVKEMKELLQNRS